MKPEIVIYPLGDNPPSAKLYYGLNVIDALRLLPDKSVHTVCTSPPYWGLRSYDEDAVMLDPDLSDQDREWVLSELRKRGIDAER